MKYTLSFLLAFLLVSKVFALDENVFVGIKVKQVELTSNTDGRLEVFGLSENGKLYHAWQVEVNGRWSFGEAFSDRTDINKFICGKRANGQIQIFALCNDRKVRSIRQAKVQPEPGSGGHIVWTGWTDLWGNAFTDIFWSKNHDGNQIIFAIDNRGTICYKKETDHYGNWIPNWIYFEGSGFSSVKAVQNQDGRVEVLTIRQGQLFHKWQVAPSNSFFAGWAQLPGIGLQEISAEKNNNGIITIFSRGGDGVVYKISQTAPNNGWEENWTNISGITKKIKSVKYSTNILGVFAVGLDDHIWHACQSTAGSNNYSGFITFGGTPIDFAVGNNHDGRMELFCVDKSDRFLHHMWQQTVGESWTGWTKFINSQILPYDLVDDGRKDENGLPLNPVWGYQKVYGNNAVPRLNHTIYGPDNQEKAEHWYDGDRPCTKTIVNINKNYCGPHVNFGAITLTGVLNFKKEQPTNTNSPAHDGDYNLSFRPLDNELITTTSPQYIEIEFDGKETANHFKTPDWRWIEELLSQDNENIIVKNYFLNNQTIVIAELNFDCAGDQFGGPVDHNCGVELHPAYALFINTDENSNSNKWLFFVRNNGNQGACSGRDTYLTPSPHSSKEETLQEIKILIPSPNSFEFKKNCIDASLNYFNNGQKTIKYTINDNNQKEKHIEAPLQANMFSSVFVPGKGVLLTFRLPKPGPGNDTDNVIYGEFTINWKFKSISPDDIKNRRY